LTVTLRKSNFFDYLVTKLYIRCILVFIDENLVHPLLELFLVSRNIAHGDAIDVDVHRFAPSQKEVCGKKKFIN